MSNNTIWTLEPKKCRKCGKEMYPTAQWVYKMRRPSRGYYWYCSWKCFNHRFDGLKKSEIRKYRYKTVEQLTPDGEFVREFDCAYSAAAAMNGSINCVREACKKGKIYKKFLWRYKTDVLSQVQRSEVEKH